MENFGAKKRSYPDKMIIDGVGSVFDRTIKQNTLKNLSNDERNKLIAAKLIDSNKNSDEKPNENYGGKENDKRKKIICEMFSRKELNHYTMINSCARSVKNIRMIVGENFSSMNDNKLQDEFESKDTTDDRKFGYSIGSDKLTSGSLRSPRENSFEKYNRKDTVDQSCRAIWRDNDEDCPPGIEETACAETCLKQMLQLEPRCDKHGGGKGDQESEALEKGASEIVEKVTGSKEQKVLSKIDSVFYDCEIDVHLTEKWESETVKECNPLAVCSYVSRDDIIKSASVVPSVSDEKSFFNDMSSSAGKRLHDVWPCNIDLYFMKEELKKCKTSENIKTENYKRLWLIYDLRHPNNTEEVGWICVSHGTARQLRRNQSHFACRTVSCSTVGTAGELLHIRLCIILSKLTDIAF